MTDDEIMKLMKDLVNTQSELLDLYHIVQTEPNDKKLGSKVRSFYWKHTDKKN